MVDRETRNGEAPSSFAVLKLQINISFLSALKFAAPTFLVLLVSSLCKLLIEAWLKGSSRLDWKFGFEFPAWFTAVWFVAVFASALADLRAEDRRENTECPSFPANSFIRGACGGLVIVSVLMMNGMYREGDSLWMQIIPLAMLVLVWFAWPRAIYFYANALGQRARWGRMKRLPYREVDYASYSHADDRTVIGGKDVEIVHTAEHADKLLFHELIEERTGKPVFGA